MTVIRASLATPALDRLLEQGAATLGLHLTPESFQRLLDYVGLIDRWNRVYNLTAVRRPEQMVVQHVLDSLAVVPAFLRHSEGRAASVLDVGAGAGLPGVVLAVVAPDLSVTCVDTVGKKASFVRQVAAELRLPNLEALHARVEDLHERTWDIVTSRAFASLSDFCRWTRPLLGERSVWAAMKGHIPDHEMRALPPAVKVFHVEQLQVPQLDASRCLVWLRPKESE